jgi:hypothetical protein
MRGSYGQGNAPEETRISGTSESTAVSEAVKLLEVRQQPKGRLDEIMIFLKLSIHFSD